MSGPDDINTKFEIGPNLEKKFSFNGGEVGYSWSDRGVGVGLKGELGGKFYGVLKIEGKIADHLNVEFGGGKKSGYVQAGVNLKVNLGEDEIKVNLTGVAKADVFASKHAKLNVEAKVGLSYESSKPRSDGSYETVERGGLYATGKVKIDNVFDVNADLTVLEVQRTIEHDWKGNVLTTDISIDSSIKDILIAAHDYGDSYFPTIAERHPGLSAGFVDLAGNGSDSTEGRMVQALERGDHAEAAREAGKLAGGYNDNILRKVAGLEGTNGRLTEKKIVDHDNGTYTKVVNTPSGPKTVVKEEGRRPILLDLDGDGIEITELSKSTQFIDAGGVGLKHRTAWAGAGDGVLFIDADSDGTISQKREYVFTEWDPTAQSDMQALRARFDSNGDGKLTAADTDFAKFKVMVTGADGSKTVQTLAALGITEINLTEDATQITLADGSAVQGQSTFVMNGVTRTVASTLLMAEALGHRVVEAISTAGSDRVVVNTGYGADGKVAFVVKSVTNATGTSVVNSFDLDGNGVVDRVQSITTVAGAGGSRTETVVNKLGASLATGVLLDRVVTTTSADGKSVVIDRDSTGGGWFDQHEVRSTAGDGSRTVTISDLAQSGLVIRSVTETMSANGLVRSTGVDEDGNGTIDLTTTHAITVAGNNSRVEVTSEFNGDGSLRARMTETISADGRVKSVVSDLDGDGDTDLIEEKTVTVNAAGAVSTVEVVKNADGLVRNTVWGETSFDALTKFKSIDMDGDGDIDLHHREYATIVANSYRVDRVQFINGDNSVRDDHYTSLVTDNITGQTVNDLNFDGILDGNSNELMQYTGVSGPNADVIKTQWVRNQDGSIKAKTQTVSTSDGTQVTTTEDTDGDGDTDTAISDVRNIAAGTRNVSFTNQDGSLRTTEFTTTSADGLTTTRNTDIDGNGTYDLRSTDAKVVAGNGSVTRTVTDHAGNGTTVTGKTTTYQSADRLTTTVTSDKNGDGFTDALLTITQAANGSKTTVETSYNANGTKSQQVTFTTSANGLVNSGASDRDGDGIYDTYTSDIVTLNVDGSRSQTVDVDNSDGSNRTLDVTNVSDDKLYTRIWSDRNGDGLYDRFQSSLKVLNANGSVTIADQVFTGGYALLSQTQTMTSDDGLVVTVNSDADGDGDYDLSKVSTTVLLNDGGTTVTQDLRNIANVLRERSVTTTSDDQRNISVARDVNGDGQNDIVMTRIIADNGTFTATESNRNGTGALQAQTVKTVSGNGLLASSKSDADGNGVFERVIEDTSVLNADGSVTKTTLAKGAAGNVFVRSVGTQSDDGLVTTQSDDLDGNGTFDRTSLSTIVLAADGVQTKTVQIKAANIAVITTSTQVTSADKRTVVESVDTDGNGFSDRVSVTFLANTGVLTTSTDFMSAGGTKFANLVTSVSADGLTKTRSVDYDFDASGDGRAELVTTDTTILGADGSTTRNLVVRNDQYVTKATAQFIASDDGLVRTTVLDLDGDGVADSRTEDSTVYKTDGSIMRALHTFDGTATETSAIVTTTSGNGLNISIAKDISGNGVFDSTKTIEGYADGSVVETTKFYATGLRLDYSRVESTSADGRSKSIIIDDNGDGYTDKKVAVQIDLNRTVVTTFEDIGLNGLTTAKAATSASLNGMNASQFFDINADGIVDITHNTSISFGADGSKGTVMSEMFGPTKATYQQTSITSANGLLITSSFDIDGDGIIDGTSTAQTILNADGSQRLSNATYYTNGDLRTLSEQMTSADGKLIVSRFDYDGNGVWDKTQQTNNAADGSRFVTETGFNRGGLPGQIFETRLSSDGLETSIIRSGNKQTITKSVLDNGSYTWKNGVAAGVGSTSIAVVHSFDSSGIETWSMTKKWVVIIMVRRGDTDYPEESPQESVVTVRLDAETKAKIIASAQNIFDTILDRDIDFTEVEQLVDKIVDLRLDKVALTNALQGAEFSSRYGSLTNAEFVQQIYLNGLGRAPSYEELSKHLYAIGTEALPTNLAAFAAQAAERTKIAIEVAESVEHMVAGNDHIATNNFDVIINPAIYERSLDKAHVASIVKNLVDTVYDRDATDQEIDVLSEKLLRDVSNPDDIIALLRAVSGEIQGVASKSTAVLAGTTLVRTVFENAFGHRPSAEDLARWQDHISSGRITENQFIASIAASVEKLSVGNTHEPFAPPVVTILNGTAIADTLTGAVGQDYIKGGDGNDSLVGGDGADRLNGEAGLDTLVGGNGNDLYEWSRNQGNDLIVDLGADRIETDILFLTDVASTEVLLSRVLNTNDLKVQIGTAGAFVTLSRMLENLAKGYGIEELRFSNGIKWNLDKIVSMVKTVAGGVIGQENYTENLFGGNGNDTLKGSAGDDSLTGNKGTDLLAGGAGQDTYFWSRGHGADTISDVALSIIDVDHLKLTDVDKSKVLLLRNQGNDDLIVRILDAIGTATEADILVTNRFKGVSVSGWTSGQGGNASALNGEGIELITFADGTSWNLSDILKNTKLTGTIVANALTGTETDDHIVGLAGNDTITALGGNDTLNGGQGNDSLVGGLGADTYIWRLDSSVAGNDGNDTINDAGTIIAEPDVLILENVASNLVSLSRINGTDDLKIAIKDSLADLSPEVITVLNRFNTTNNAQYGIDIIRFADGVEWDLKDIQTRTWVNGTAIADTLTGTTMIDNIAGGDGADVISTSLGDDRLVGGKGADTLDGAGGNDRFEWKQGDGNDLVKDSSVSLTEVDTLALLDVASTAATFSQSGTNLIISIAGGTTETITVENRFNAAGEGYGIEFISFNDGIVVEILARAEGMLIYSGLETAQTNLGWALSDSINGLGGNDIIDSKNGDDTLNGGDGNDTLKGGNGSDSYIWGLGDDSDLIDDLGTSRTEIDRLDLNGVNAANVTFNRIAGSVDLQMLIDGGINGILTIKNRFAAASGTTYFGYGIEEIIFDDGTLLTLDEIFDRTQVNGLAGNDSLSGTDHRDKLFGNGGADTLNGLNGRDTLIGGSGNDSLAGGANDDTYVWSKGDGNDTINDSTEVLGTTDLLKLVDVLPTEVLLSRVLGSNNLIVTIVRPTGNEVITVINRFYDPTKGLGIDAIEFGNGVVWTLADILRKTTASGTGSIVGTNYSDNLVGSAIADTLAGFQGDDVLWGKGGIDLLRGFDTNEQSSNGNDRYIWVKGDGNDIIDEKAISFAEIDTLQLTDVASTDVVLSRVSGNTDLLIKVNSTLESIKILYQFWDSSKSYGIERVEFSNGVVWTVEDIYANTSVQGSALAETLTGTGFADRMFGNAGNDTLNGGAGDDNLDGGLGADRIDGGVGIDNVSYQTSTTAVQVDLNLITAQIGAVGSTQTGDIFVALEGIQGSQYGDVITGNTWSNKLIGLGGNDTIFGGIGFDLLYGGDGNDSLDGGTSSDILDGGFGADVFRFNDAAFGDDTINGFVDGSDRLSFALAVADDISDFVIAGNGTDRVSVTLGSNTISVVGLGLVTLSAADFIFV